MQEANYECMTLNTSRVYISWDALSGIILGKSLASERREYVVSHWLSPYTEWLLLYMSACMCLGLGQE